MQPAERENDMRQFFYRGWCGIMASYGTGETRGERESDTRHDPHHGGSRICRATDIADIKSSMVTKDDVAKFDNRLDRVETRLGSVEMHLMSVETQMTSIESELRSIRRDLDDLSEKFENVSSYRKEIDHALERIAAIEKHLGIDQKIAA
jgi:uncharacterized coiled-coil protein SlyX